MRQQFLMAAKCVKLTQENFNFASKFKTKIRGNFKKKIHLGNKICSLNESN